MKLFVHHGEHLGFQQSSKTEVVPKGTLLAVKNNLAVKTP